MQWSSRDEEVTVKTMFGVVLKVTCTNSDRCAAPVGLARLENPGSDGFIFIQRIFTFF